MTAFGEIREVVDPNLKPDDRWDDKHATELLQQRTANLQAQIRTLNKRLERVESAIME